MDIYGFIREERKENKDVEGSQKQEEIPDISLSCLNKINFKFGNYFVEEYNYVDNKTVDHQLDNDLNQFGSKIKPLIVLPSFNLSDDKKKLTIIDISEKNIISQIKKNRKNRSPLSTQARKYIFLKISYIDKYDKETNRVVGAWSFVDEALEFKDDKHSVDPINVTDVPSATYLRGYCYLRKDIRYFKVDKIKKIEVFDLTP